MTKTIYNQELRKLHRQLHWTAVSVGKLGRFWLDAGKTADEYVEEREAATKAASDAYARIFRAYIDLCEERGLSRDKELEEDDGNGSEPEL